MNAKSFAASLRRLGACQEARAWARGKTLAEAWGQCERGDWMLWLAARRAPRRLVVLAACACARTALVYAPAVEERPRRAIEIAERWARGDAVTPAECRAAYFAAYFAAYAADVAAYAAAAAAAAAADDAYAAYAADDALRKMAALVRQHIPAPQLECEAERARKGR